MSENSFASRAKSSGGSSYQDILNKKNNDLTANPIQTAINDGFADCHTNRQDRFP